MIFHSKHFLFSYMSFLVLLLLLYTLGFLCQQFSFTRDGSLPKVGNVVINNKLLANEVLAANIGTHGCVHNARKSVVARLAEWFNKTADGKVAVNGK